MAAMQEKRSSQTADDEVNVQ